MKIKNLVFVVLGLLLIYLIVSRINANKEADAGSKGGGPKSDKPIPVQAIIAAAEPFSEQLAVSGNIEANETIEIRPEVSGIVTGIYFEEGSSVRAGQLLIKINDVDLRAQLGSAQTKMKLASETLRRAKLLFEKEAISKEELDVANSDFEMAKSATEFIRAQIQKTSIIAPFSGKIGLRSISKGAYVTPQTLIGKLVQSNTVKLTFAIPEKYSSLLQNNSNIQFRVAGIKDTLTARIYAIEPEIATETRAMKIRAKADNKTGKLFPGTFADVLLNIGENQKAIFVPTEAVIPIQNGQKVFVAKNGKATEKQIESISRDNQKVAVASGLTAGDTVIVSGVMALKEGSLVKPAIVKK